MRGLPILLFAAVVCAGHPVTAQGRFPGDPEPVPPQFPVWIGLQDTPPGAAPMPGLGLEIGARAHPRVRLSGEGFITIYPQIQGWYALGGARLTPVLRPAARLDLDLRAGAGNHGMIKGRYWIDGAPIPVYLVLRTDVTLLGAVDPVLGMGPRLRLETQPVPTMRVGHLEDGTEERTPRLAWRSHQLLAGGAWELDVGQGNHLGWEVLVGVTAFGDHGWVTPTIHVALGWSWDERPARAACRAAGGV